MGITLNKKKYNDEVADNKSATSFSVNGIDIKDKPVNSSSDIIKGIISQETGKSFIIDKEKYIKELERNQVQLNKYITEEEINKQRAKNQSWIEQTGRSLAQIVGNEVILGSLNGFSNIFDMAVTAAKELYADATGEESVNDFTSGLSLALEQAQDKIKERLEIYRENPNQAFDISDFGWWADNFVTVGSTLSLLIPTLATTKGVSALGRVSSKALKLGKTANEANKAQKILEGSSFISRSVAKSLYKHGLTKTPATLASKIDAGLSISGNAFLQRSLENWQEAREVYKTTYEDALNRLNNFTEEDKNKFFENNPEIFEKFGNSSNEEIASYIAEQSSYKTFGSDYAMLLMDIAQFAAIPGMYRGLTNRASTGNLKIIQENLKRNLNGISGTLTKGGIEATDLGKNIIKGAGDKSIKNNLFNRVKEAAKNPGSLLYSMQLTEGIEEGFQGIASEKGKEVAELIFNPNLTTRNLESYLSDGHIWEQAVWGILGSWAFQGGGALLFEAEKSITAKINKDKMSEEDFAHSQLTDEKLRELEILGRADKIKDYQEKLRQIDEGINPYDREIMNDEERKPLTQEEKDNLKRKATTDFVTHLVLDAADNGNYELLKEFISSTEFNQYLKDSGLYDNFDSTFNKDLLSKSDEIIEDYKNNLYTALEYADEDKPWIANIAARNITRANLQIEDIEKQISEISAINDTTQNFYNQRAEIEYLNDYLTQITKQHAMYKVWKDMNIISSQAYDKYIEELEKELYAVANNGYISINKEEYGDLSSLSTVIKNKINGFKNNNSYIFDETQNPLPDKTIVDAAKQIAFLEAKKRKTQAIIPHNNEEWNNEMQDIFDIVTEVGKKRYKDASARLRDFVTKAENPQEAFQRLMNNEEVYEGAVSDLDLIKIGHHTTKPYWELIRAAAYGELDRRKKVEEQENTPKENNEVIPEKEVKPLEAVVTLPVEGESTLKQTPQSRQITEEELIFNDNEKEESISKEIEKQLEEEAKEQQKAKQSQTPDSSVDKFIESNKRLERTAKIIAKAASYLGNVLSQEEEVREAFRLNNINDEGFDYVFDSLKSFIEETEKIEDEDVINRIIYEAIKSEINKRIRLLTKRNKNTDSLIELLNSLNKANKFSSIGLLTLNKTERDKLLFNELSEFIKEKYGLKRVTKVTKRAVNVIEFFNYLTNKYNYTSDDLILYYRFINEYIETGYNNITFAGIEEFNKGFRSFISNIRKINSADSSFDSTTFSVLDEMQDMDIDVYQQMMMDIASGKIKSKVYIDTSRTTYTVEYKAGNEYERFESGGTLEVYYIDENGHRRNLGYLPKARYINGNNTALLNNAGLGFSHEFHGYNSNFDALFEALELAALENEGDYILLYNELLNYVLNPNDYEVSDEAKEILNLPLIKELISTGNGIENTTLYLDPIFGEENDIRYHVPISGGIRFKYNKNGITTSKTNQVKIILGGIYRHIKDVDGNINPEEIMTSYEGYKIALHDAMLKNIEIQEAITSGKEVTAEVFDVYDSITLNVNEDEAISINEAVDFSNSENHPIIFDNGEYIGITEDGTTYTLPVWNQSERLSMLVYDIGGKPLIAPLNRNGLVDSKSTIVEDVKEELRNIIRDFLTPGKLSHHEATQKLIRLLQGNARTKLFSGINVKEFNGITYVQADSAKYAYTEDGEENPEYGTFLIAFNKYAKTEDKKTRKEQDHYVISHLTKGKKVFGRRTLDEGDTDSYVEWVVDKIVNAMKFNLSIFAINADPNAKQNEYFYKEDGKIVINIGGNKRVYNSYSEFIHKENAATLFLHKGKDRKLYSVQPSEAYGLGNIKYTVVEKLYTEDGTEIRTLDELYQDLQQKEKTIISTRTLLNIAGLDENLIDILFGSETGIPIIHDKIVYKKGENVANEFGAYNPSTGEIRLGDRVFERTDTAVAQKNRLYELIRTLIHENFHKLFEENSDNKFIDKRVLELINTLQAFQQAIKNDTSNSEQVVKIKETFKTFLEDYNIKNGKFYNKDGKSLNKKDSMKVVEEWLVESLTQPLLMDYLNKTEYRDADITKSDKGKKSIFQKIIDAIINLFTNIFGKQYKIGKIKNNTIFAKQYLILSNELTSPPTKEEETKKTNQRKKNNRKNKQKVIEQTNEVEIQENISTESQQPIVIQPVEEESLLEQEDELFDEVEEEEEEDDFIRGKRFSTIPIVLIDDITQDENSIEMIAQDATHNPNGIIQTQNMDNYLDRFSEEEKPKIASLLSENELKYACR